MNYRNYNNHGNSKEKLKMTQETGAIKLAPCHRIDCEGHFAAIATQPPARVRARHSELSAMSAIGPDQ